MKIFLSIFLITFSVFQSQPINLDEFNSIEQWKSFTSEGVVINTSTVDGYKGKAIRIDYNFTKGSGYGGIQKIIPVEVPANYQFTFYLKAQSPNNNLEFKLLDASGENVWWVNNRNYEFPAKWKKIIVKKRHIGFAWGPAQDQTLKKIERIEFTISSLNGGKGTVYIDELNFETLPEISNQPPEPLVTVSSTQKKSSINYLYDKNPQTIWRNESNEKQEIIFDFREKREFGGLKILWDEKNFARKFNVLVSNDGKNWDKVYKVENCNGGKSYIRLNEYESAFLKIDLLKSDYGKGFGIKEIEIKNVDWSADINSFFMNIAKESPRGIYPRYLYEEASYWTVIGTGGDVKEAMMNEEGMIEVDKQNFSLEPFLFYDGKLKTWNDSKTIQSLEENYLPIPIVKWLGDVQLEIKAFADGEPNKSSVLYLSYSLKNVSEKLKKGNLFLAIRPFQVNPYYQWLNITGGAAKVKSIKYSQNKISVNDEKVVIPLSKPDSFGAARFDEGDVVTFLAKNKLPLSKFVEDNFGYASGALRFGFDLKPGEEKTFYIAVPFYKEQHGSPAAHKKQFEQKLAETKRFWKEKISKVKFNLPASADKIVNTIRSNIAYILINRDKAGIQPGSRSYERSWIRDGSLTSSALLKNGIVDEVKEFIEWYSANQFENGKVPCVVDSRGPDPVPENDSHGEFIYLIKQYFNFTRDTTFLKSKYNNVKRAVNYIEFLIAQRSNDYYKNGNDSTRAYFGIVPESISHEGYSAKPMHSYWDNFWTLKGLKDAVEIAFAVGDKKEAERISEVSSEFKKNLYNSIQLAVKNKKIDFIPGSVELGDFDATSTTIAISPVGELNNLPQPLLQNTFDRYFAFAEKRADLTTDWQNYTPYEVRAIGTFIFLDQPERAHKLIDFFLKDQRPQGWNHWAEVVWKDKRIPRFIGDMPHTWVGSDFINSMRALFVYENEYDSSLVACAGLYKDWIDSPNGILIEKIPTYYGEFSYSVKKEDSKYEIKFFG
ncbi:MAG: discoidin domain-containing protein, partial [Bacteroidota bacterium]